MYTEIYLLIHFRSYSFGKKCTLYKVVRKESVTTNSQIYNINWKIRTINKLAFMCSIHKRSVPFQTTLAISFCAHIESCLIDPIAITRPHL